MGCLSDSTLNVMGIGLVYSCDFLMYNVLIDDRPNKNASPSSNLEKRLTFGLADSVLDCPLTKHDIECLHR